MRTLVDVQVCAFRSMRMYAIHGCKWDPDIRAYKRYNSRDIAMCGTVKVRENEKHKRRSVTRRENIIASLC